MLKRATFLTGAVLIALMGYLPFELSERDELIARHGAVFFCIPITFVAIPAVVAVFLALIIKLARSKSL